VSGFLRAHRARALVVAFALPFLVTPAGASSEKVVYAFLRDIDGTGDGAVPSAGLVADQDGNLYGTTIGGGSAGEGTVFRIAPGGSETILHSFTGGQDGYSPEAALIIDDSGSLYGTTTVGGLSGNNGTVFRIAPNGTETQLYVFTGGSDGGKPIAGLIADGGGNLYGTTHSGGANNKGVVFKLAPNGIETVLHSFMGGSDGAYPEAGLIADGQGNLYGTTLNGGSSDNGTVFKLTPDGTETVLHQFMGHSDGSGPMGDLVADSKGNLYGTVQFGGLDSCQLGCGIVFKVAPDGTESVFYSFAGGKDGRQPSSRLIADRRGNLYGSTLFGGQHNEGAVFKLTRQGTETVLYSFDRRLNRNGFYPSGPLLADATFTHLYGETSGGGHKQGVVYVVRP
jgi:uncharacterized repeat protein (TIGR03803 family)